MNCKESMERKSLLYKTGVEYGDYTINHVQGCSHGCMYPCYAFMMARRFGKTVLRTKADLKLDPMPADERKVMHQEIAKMDHLKTESKGEGKNRYMTISYVD